MLSKCANPACFVSFRFLHQGKIFAVDPRPSSLSAAAETEGWVKQQSGAVEFYWLCTDCARDLTLRIERGHVVTAKIMGARAQSGNGPA
ncbi:MAG TPA: hypothetical protein VK473_12265 [Terriglobales bacterium]|nr:hypothetical protein [Terriglobales bacterium]